ncbi:MAG: hypothetical protein OHK0057_12370 [Thermoflexibacter sp.]
MLNKEIILQKLALLVANLDEASLQELSDVLEKLVFSENESISLATVWAIEEDNSQRLGFINIKIDKQKQETLNSATDCWQEEHKAVLA